MQRNVSSMILDADNPIATPPVTTPHTCTDGYFPYWYGCYKLYTINLTWSLAESRCDEDGGHLASIQSEAENAAIFLASANQDGAFPIWIGLYNVCTSKLCLL